MNDEWETPQDLFDALDNIYRFDFDAACTKANCKCKGGAVSEIVNSLELDWHRISKSIWLNPPYSRGNINKFMKKAWEESQEGCTVVCLVRFDPSAKWYQKYVYDKAAEVLMLARRVKFIGAKSAYNFPCCVVIYYPPDDFYDYLTTYRMWDWK